MLQEELQMQSLAGTAHITSVNYISVNRNIYFMLTIFLQEPQPKGKQSI